MAVTRLIQFPFEQNYPQSPAQEDRGLYMRYGDIYTFLEGSSNPYTGSRSLQFSARQSAGFGFPIPSGTDDLRCGFFWAADRQGENSNLILRLDEADNATPLLSVLSLESEGYIDLRIAGASVQKASTAEFPHFMDTRQIYCHHGFHLLGGSRFVYLIDGVAVLDYSDVSVPTGVDFVWMMESASWGSTNYIDDWYLDDMTGESYVIPPSYRYMMSLTNADGHDQNWAGYPNSGSDYEKVDESGVDDEDTYVWTPSSNSIEMFDTTDITVPNGHSIVSAIPWVLARKRDVSQASQIRMKVYDGSYADGSDKDLPGFYAEVWDRFETDPSAAPWAQATFNSAEFGFETRGTV